MNEIPEGKLAKLNKYSWSFFIRSKTTTYLDPVDTLSCLLINICQEQFVNDPRNFAYVHIPNMVFDLQREIEIAYYVDDPENEFILNKSDKNDRVRGKNTVKNDDGQMNLDYLKDTSFFARKAGELGFMWAEEVKKDKYALPSPFEIIDGLRRFHEIHVEDQMKGQPLQRIIYIKRNYKMVFMKILEFAGITDIHEPLQYSETEENGLYNPEGRAVMLILWLYSIEPPFYSYLNKAMRKLDTTYLQLLGPFAKALHVIIVEAEKNRKDALRNAEEIIRFKEEDPLGNQSCMFLHFKGIPMSEEALNDWKEAVNSEKQLRNNRSIAGHIKLRGIMSATENVRLAIQNALAQKETNPSMIPTLFVICFHNFSCWYPYYGFRMNSQNFSAHHYEREMILMDGITMLVLKIEDCQIKWDDNEHESDDDADEAEAAKFWKELNGQKIRVIYLFNA